MKDLRSLILAWVIIVYTFCGSRLCLSF